MKTAAIKISLAFILGLCLIPSVFADRRVVGEYITIYEKSCSNGLSGVHSGEDVHLSCPSYFQTTNYTCGPAAVMTMMRYYGRLKPSEMNQKTELKIASEMGASAEGTSLSDVSSWLSNHGFHVETGSHVTAAVIIENLKNKTPVLLGFNKHWVLAKGFVKSGTSDTDEIDFSDSCCGTTTIDRATLDSLWSAGQMNHDKCVGNGEYIIATLN